MSHSPVAPAVGRLMVLAMAALIGAVSGEARSPPPSRWQVSTMVADRPVVPVDVRVVDEHGKPVTNLTRDEFTITEDGAPQSIRTFSLRTVSDGPSASGRHFLVVLGSGRLAPAKQSVAAAAAFVRQLLPGDAVGVITWDRAIGLTTDHERVAALLDRDAAAHETIASHIIDWHNHARGKYGPKEIPDAIQAEIDRLFEPPPSRQPAETSPPDSLADLDAWVHQAAKSDVDLSKVYAGVEYLRGIEGEKHLIFVTDQDLPRTVAEDDRTLGARASDARVSVHVSRGPASELAALATLTGGTLDQGGTWAKTFSAIDAATRFEYVIEYQSTRPATVASMRSVAVAVTRPHLTVVSRRLYFAPALAVLTPDGIVAYSRMLSADVRSPDFRMKAKASDVRDGDAHAVDVQLTIDAAGVSFETVGHERVASLQVLVICSDYARNETAWHSASLTLPADGRPPSGDMTVTVRSPVVAEPSRVMVIVYSPHADVVAATYAR